MARLYLQNGDADQARDLLAMAPADAKDPDLDSVRVAIKLAGSALRPRPRRWSSVCRPTPTTTTPGWS